MAQPEALLSQLIVRKVEEHFPCCMLEKNHGSVFGAVRLDLRGSVNGYAVEIETKMPGNKPSPRQAQRIRHLQKLKVITGWCTSPEEAIAIIEQGLKEKT